MVNAELVLFRDFCDRIKNVVGYIGLKIINDILERERRLLEGIKNAEPWLNAYIFTDRDYDMSATALGGSVIRGIYSIAGHVVSLF